LAMAAAATLLPAGAISQYLHMQSDALPAVASGTPASLKGRAAVDLMPGKRNGLGYPLRFGNVIPGTVRLELDGRHLEEGKDFTVDYGGGAVFISGPVKDSSSIRVSYRHDPEAKSTLTGNALPLLALNFGDAGSVRMLMGFSGAQRFADGSMVQSNNVGIQNSLSFGSGKLSGFFLVSSQSETTVSADGASPDKTAPRKGENATDYLLMQSFDLDVGGVKLTADYTDVGEKFVGFGMLQGSGVSDERAKQLEKEKGITRMGFGLSNESPKGLSFNNSYRTIDDGDAKITFQNYSVKSSMFDAYYTSRAIDSGFKRFNDLAEADRNQMQKERGITREALGGRLGLGFGELKFDRNSISENGDGIFRQSLALSSDWIRGSWQTQEISANFNRSNDLSEQERAQWHKERGIARESLSLATGESIKGVSAQFDQKSIEYSGRTFQSMAFDVSTSIVDFKWWSRETDRSFARLGDLPQAELDALIQQTLQMYDPKAGVNGNDRGFIVREAGLSRDFMKIASSPVKDLGLSYQRSTIDGEGGGLEYTVAGVDSKSVKLDYRRTKIDESFSRIHDLLDAERKLYGLQAGFDRTDFAGHLALGGKSSLGFSALDVSSQQGGLQRYSANLSLPGFEFKGNYRNVDSNFERAIHVNDNERQFFQELIGYRQFDAGLKFNGIKGLNVEAFVYDADNGSQDLHRYRRNGLISYTPNKSTAFKVVYNSHKLEGMPGMLFENDLFAVEGFQDFGRFGKLTARKETESYSGIQGTLPDRDTYYAKYETKLGPKSDFSTEQVRTTFSDGGYENIQAYKLGWQVFNRLNVNVTQIFVDRDGDKPDIETRNYGFVYDLGNGMKLGWSWHRELNSAGNGKRNYSWNLTPGQMGGFEFGGGYEERRIDNTRTTALGNFTFKNQKPMNVGFIKDLQVNLGYDSHTDGGVWKKENTLASISFKAFGSAFGADYGHVMLPNQLRAADRTLRFNLDPTGKNPLQASFVYKIRTLPGGEGQIIRDYDVSYKLNDKFTLMHSLDTLPEKQQQNVPLGSLALPRAKNIWAIGWHPNAGTSATFGFEEERLLDQNALTRRLAASVCFFKDLGSPLTLRYALEQNHRPDGKRFTRNAYELMFEQKPGPNQTFSFAVGYINWLDGIAVGDVWNNWNLRLDYQLRF